jgi:hypothetical protein
LVDANGTAGAVGDEEKAGHWSRGLASRSSWRRASR